jgi:hypothetical protein
MIFVITVIFCFLETQCHAMEKKNHENNVYVPSSFYLRGVGKGGENDNNHKSLDIVFFFSQVQQWGRK